MYPCTKYKLYLHRLKVLATYFGKFNLSNGSNKEKSITFHYFPVNPSCLVLAKQFKTSVHIFLATSLFCKKKNTLTLVRKGVSNQILSSYT